MKEGIHPKYVEATVECACGNVINTKSTRGSFKIDICSKCHPFFSGKQKLLDSAGRVDRFRKKYGLKDTSEIPAPAQAPAAPEVKPEVKPEAKTDEKADAKKG